MSKKIVKSMRVCDKCGKKLIRSDNYYSIYDYDIENTVDLCSDCIDIACREVCEEALNLQTKDRDKYAYIGNARVEFNIINLQNHDNFKLLKFHIYEMNVDDKYYLVESDSDIIDISSKLLKDKFSINN